MADTKYTVEHLELASAKQVVIVKWDGIGKDESGVPWLSGEHTDKTVHILGSFSDSTVVIEGTNESTPTNFVVLTDPQGNSISKVVTAVEVVVESPLYIRPRVSGGTVPLITVIMVMRKSKK